MVLIDVCRVQYVNVILNLFNKTLEGLGSKTNSISAQNFQVLYIFSVIRKTQVLREGQNHWALPQVHVKLNTRYIPAWI